MNKLILFPLLLFSFSTFGSNHLPGGEKFNLLGAQYKAFIKQKDITHKLSFEGRQDYHQENSTSISYSTSYKFSPTHRITSDIFYQSGLRHNDDWTFKNNEWIWNSTATRYEPLVQIGYKLKAIPSPFLPITLDFQSHLKKNFFNQQESIILKPGFSYFKLENGLPAYSLHPSFIYYYPLNFHETKEYKKGFYIVGLYHLNKSFQLGVKFESLIEQWSTSKDFKDRRSETYIKEDQTNRLKILLNHHF